MCKKKINFFLSFFLSFFFSFFHFPDGGKTTPVGKETTCPRHSGRFQVRKTAGKPRNCSGKTAKLQGGKVEKTAGKQWDNGDGKWDGKTGTRKEEMKKRR